VFQFIIVEQSLRDSTVWCILILNNISKTWILTDIEMRGNQAWPQDVDGKDVGVADLVESLPVPRLDRAERTGSETRSCVWSSDLQWFAWSCGHTVVKIMPWSRTLSRTDNKGNNDNTEDNKTGLNINTGNLVWSMAFGIKSLGDEVDVSKSSNRLSSLQLNLVPGEVILATGQSNGRIRIWNVITGLQKFELCDHTAQIESLKFSPDGQLKLASVCGDGTMKFWDLNDGGNLYRTVKSPHGVFHDCCWSPDCTRIVTVGDRKAVCLWDLRTFVMIRRLDGHHHHVCQCEFSPDGAVLATSSFDTRVILWDTNTGTQLLQLNHCQPAPLLMFAGGANGMYVRSLSFSPDGLFIATVCDDGLMRVWDLSQPEVPVKASRVRGALTCKYCPSGTVIAVGSSKGGVSLWRSPLAVSSLQRLARTAVRRLVHDSRALDELTEIPTALRHYLAYRHEWVY